MHGGGASRAPLGAPRAGRGSRERDGSEGPPEVKRSQPLLIHGSRWCGARGVLAGSRGHQGSSPNRCPHSRLQIAHPQPEQPGPGTGTPPRRAPPSESGAGGCHGGAPIWGGDTPQKGQEAGWEVSPSVLPGSPHSGGALPPPRHPQVVKVFGEDGACRSLEASAATTARQLCDTLVRRTRALHDHSWAHWVDTVQELLGARPADSHSFVVRAKNRKVTELFKSNAEIGYETTKQNHTPKNTSNQNPTEPHLADLTESNIYYVTQGKKLYGTPTEFGFCRWGCPPHKVRSGVKGLKLLCSEDEQSRSCWMAAFRLFKYGMQLYRNYQQAQARLSQPSWIGPTPLRSVSDNALVAMDFSGCTGRVIENPSEVLTAALEEAQAWRVSWGPDAPLPTAIHRTQPWFHGRISREDTQQLIGRQGMVDGVFLVRESQRNPKGFVLSLCHLQRIKHYLILPSEEEGRLYFTMDDGQTRFADLIQLVEFHQINRGILPCKLRHYCTCVAL
uniref:Growth factor receptor bound protein 7 n=1 Tax=Malurus cyaneus samueli TaxID=2593467 RepID=A0A8C5UHM3_9PASS